MGTRSLSLVPLLVVLVLGAARPAAAGPRDFVITMSGFLGTTEQAAPVLSKLFQRLEKNLGWPAKSIRGSYHPSAEEGLRALKGLQPGFAVVSHQMYAELRGPMKMEVLGAMELADGALSRFHVVTRAEGGPTKLSGLVGKTIASPHLGEVLFAERILLGGRVKLGSGGATAEDVRAPLSALRKVARGQVDAAIVDEPVFRQLDTLPFGSELRVVHSTEVLPALPVVALGNATAADRQAMTKALGSLCSGAEGAELCASLRLEAVRPATDRTYAPLLQKLH